uniref:Uncharacterized protein n=1 Tax=Cacopsylla melanoneura TaxID=428564 RepID=A0A8D9BBN6_9HEMI
MMLIRTQPTNTTDQHEKKRSKRRGQRPQGQSSGRSQQPLLREREGESLPSDWLGEHLTPSHTNYVSCQSGVFTRGIQRQHPEHKQGELSIHRPLTHHSHWSQQ